MLHTKPKEDEMFKATHTCEMADGTRLPVRIIRLDPPFAYGRQAVVEFKDEPGENYRVGCSRLQEIDAGAQGV